MTSVFHALLYGRFTKIQSNLRRTKLHRSNQGTFSNWDNVRAQIQFRRESQSQHLKDDLSSRTDSSIFTSVAAVLLDWSNETIWVFPALISTSHFLPQSTVSCRSYSSSEANSSYCHNSDTWVRSSIISIDSNITDNTVSKVINV